MKKALGLVPENELILNSPEIELNENSDEEYGAPEESRSLYEVIWQYVGLFIKAVVLNTE